MLIELKDGDTIIISRLKNVDDDTFYDKMCESLARGLKDVNFFTYEAAEQSISVYRALPAPAPVEEHDGWFTWDSAPQDGQEIDVWIPGGRGRVPEVYFEHGAFFYYDEGDKCDLITRFGNPSHWRYPPKGPQA